MKSWRAWSALLALSTLSLLSCNNEDVVSNRYCSLPARFSFDNIQQAPQLNHACNSLGEWCTITRTTFGFLFANVQGSTEVNLEKLQGYSGFYMGLAGFVVGKPYVAEMGKTEPVVTCYDLACRNCYDEFSIARPMELLENGYVRCNRTTCGRVYDLNNEGRVYKGVAGEKNRPLYRYYAYCVGFRFAISNH